MSDCPNCQKLATENAKLRGDMNHTVQLLEKLVAANTNLGGLLISTSNVLNEVTNAMKGKGYG
jgi:hypothetical protein